MFKLHFAETQVKAEIERRANESNQSYVNCQGAPATEK